MKRFVERQSDDTPILLEGEIFHYDVPRVGIAFRDKDATIGTFHLWITTQRVLLTSADAAFQFDVPYIVLHAVTRDPDSYPSPCVYCQLDYEGDDDDEEEGKEEVDNKPLLTPRDEMFIVPEREEQLKDIFDALSHAALLNPSLNEFDEQEGEDELYYNEEEVAQGSLNAEQARVLDHLESVFVVPEVHSVSNGQDPGADTAPDGPEGGGASDSSSNGSSGSNSG
jgi:Regulator of volume decrease after cellular swelling